MGMSKLEQRKYAILVHIRENTDPTLDDVFELFDDHELTENAIYSLIKENAIFIESGNTLKRIKWRNLDEEQKLRILPNEPRKSDRYSN